MAQVFFPKNVWPEEAPLLQPCMESMYLRLTRVAEALLQVFAVALEAPPDFFRDKVDRHHSNMQVRHTRLGYRHLLSSNPPWLAL